MSDDSLFLEWTSHKQNLTSNLKKLLMAQEYVDVTLVAERHSIGCHRLILSASSIFFESILQGTEGNYPVIVLPPEIKLWHMQAMVDYMYLGELAVEKAELKNFLNSAKMLKIRGLYDIADHLINDKPKHNGVQQDIKPNLPDTNNNFGTTAERSQQVVSTATNDRPASINNEALGYDTKQPIKEAGTQGPPPMYQDRGPILNNVACCTHPPIPPETPICRDITKSISARERVEHQLKKQPRDTAISQTPTSIDGNSSNSEHRSHIEPPVSCTLKTGPASMHENSTNIPGYYDHSMSRCRLFTFNTHAFEVLKRENSSSAPSEKRIRFSDPQQFSNAPTDRHSLHKSRTVPPKMVPSKRNAIPKNLRGSTTTTPLESQPFQQFNMPSNHGPLPMHLPQPPSTFSGFVPPTNITPQCQPHVLLYLYPNLRVFAYNYENYFQM